MADFGDYEHDRILRQTVKAAAQHAYGVTGSSERVFDPGDVLEMLSPRQILALHRVAQHADLNGDGSVDYGRRTGPRLPTAGARDLKEALHGILAVQAASASAPPEGELTAGEQQLDRGLRSLFAEEQLESFTERNGIRPRGSLRLVQDRTVDSRVHAPAARSMVDSLAKATGASREEVLSRLLATPADQRFQLAAAVMMGRGEGMAADHREHATNRMAQTMDDQFAKLGSTAKKYGRIGRQWKRQHPIVKGLVYAGMAAAVVTQPWVLPVLIAARIARPIQRLQRAQRELTAVAQGSRGVGKAQKILAHEFEVAGRLAPGRRAATLQAPGRTGPAAQPGSAPQQAGPPQVHVPGIAPDGTDLTTHVQPQAPDRADLGPPPVTGAPMPPWMLQGQGPATAPVQTAPVQTAPVQTAPVQTAPVQTAPVQTAPVETAPSGTAPVETAPGEAAQHQAAQGEAAQGEAGPGEVAGAEEGQPVAAEAGHPGAQGYRWPGELAAFPGDPASPQQGDHQVWNTAAVATAGVADPRAGTRAEAEHTTAAARQPSGHGRTTGPTETERH